MTPRTVLALAALAALISPSWSNAQFDKPDKSNRLRESKLETYMARAQAALGRLEDELRAEHLDGAKVAAKELRQALAALEKTRRSGGNAPADPWGQMMFNRATSQPSKKKGANPFLELIKANEQRKKAEQPERFYRESTNEGSDTAPPNPLQQIWYNQQKEKAKAKAKGKKVNENEASESAFQRLFYQQTQPPADPDKTDGKDKKTKKAKRKVYERTPYQPMATQDPPATYRELELNGQTVIVPEKLLGGGGEVTQEGSQLVIRKGAK